MTETDAPVILFVDDDCVFLELLTHFFALQYQDRAKIFVAETSDQALEVLKRETIHLAVMDLNMPLMDGLQLLQLLQTHYPALCKIILSGVITAQLHRDCLAAGAALILEKPIQTEDWNSICTNLLGLAKDQKRLSRV